MVMIKQGGGDKTKWRFERKQGGRYVSAGSADCTEAEAKGKVDALAAEHGGAKGTNGWAAFEVDRGSRRLSL
jgi:hypothetical protein